MKKEQREVYIVLTNEANFTLCSFCKYADFSGSCYLETEIECKHPLADRLESQWGYFYSIEPGGDCWGFRPSHPTDYCADIVGIVLAKGWSAASWWTDKKGVLRIAGIRSKGKAVKGKNGLD